MPRSTKDGQFRAQCVDDHDEEGIWDYLAWVNVAGEGKQAAESLLSMA